MPKKVGQKEDRSEKRERKTEGGDTHRERERLAERETEISRKTDLQMSNVTIWK